MVKLSNNTSEISAVERVHQRQFIRSMAVDVGMSAVNMLPQMLAGMFSGSGIKDSTPTNDSVPANDSAQVSESGGVGSGQEELLKEEKIDTVVKLIQTKKPNFPANSAHIDKLVSNYDLYRDIYKLSDEDLVTRLCSYYDALISHDVQQYYGVLSAKYEAMYIEQTGKSKEELTETDYREILKLCIENEETEETEGTKGHHIEIDNNSAIQNEITKRGNGPVNEDYLKAQINRGLGYVDLYDINHDNQVDFDEFCKLEAKDSGVEVFNMMDKNNDTYIDAKEIASHLYAIARINDSSKDTSHDISFVEWAWAQNPDFAQRISNYGDVLYNGIKDMDYPPSVAH